MRGPTLSPELARVLNFLGVMAMVGVLLGAYIYQFSYRELPCTLCLLQRLAMFAVAFGAAMNLMLRWAKPALDRRPARALANVRRDEYLRFYGQGWSELPVEGGSFPPIRSTACLNAACLTMTSA